MLPEHTTHTKDNRHSAREAPVKVGCIGLGDIAQKAYLPVLTTLPGVELHLQTRTPATLARIAETHHIPAGRRHTDLDSLLAQGLDAAFVHAPTSVHAEIVDPAAGGGRADVRRQAARVRTGRLRAAGGASPRSAAPASPSASTAVSRPATPSAWSTRAS